MYACCRLRVKTGAQLALGGDKRADTNSKGACNRATTDKSKASQMVIRILPAVEHLHHNNAVTPYVDREVRDAVLNSLGRLDQPTRQHQYAASGLT